jgi:plastocyanin
LIKKTFILPVLAVAAIAAGCGSDSSTGSSPYGEPTAAATGTAAPEKAAATEAPGATSETAEAPAAGAASGAPAAGAASGAPAAGAASGAPAAGAASGAPAAGAASGAPADDAASGAPAAAAISVDIADFAFAPNAIEAKVGQKITFTNQDSAPHTATATAGAKFDSGQLDQGKSFSYTAKKAGTIKFVCSLHPNMTGTITVS